jgi:predicted KAP-like P-loop ATPase
MSGEATGEQLGVGNYADLPIADPKEDLFGIDPFARSLADSIRQMPTPQGVVIAVNGPWGSGKSSAINLIAHHLADAVATGELHLVHFNPWWFRGEEALVLAFFRELYAATNPSLGGKAKKALSKLGARLLKAGGVVGAGADALGAGGLGGMASGAMDWLSGLIEDGESVEDLHRELATALAGQCKRFVVIIDDIDRLAPDEALAMFRLVKSVGRLPNVIYLLAFDRILAERVVSERFPSEGPHYLEKIVQASFELPTPEASELTDQLLSRIVSIVGDPDESRVIHFMNMFHAIVAPEVRTPRDVVRYVNALSVTWPAVAGEVEPGDFIAIEAYRIFQPAIYQAVRSLPQDVCGPSSSGYGRDDEESARLEAALLENAPNKTHYRQGLMRLFPRLEGVWSNMHYGSDFAPRWSRQRRVCAKEHFPTYFRLALGSDAVSEKEISELVERAGDEDFVTSKMMAALATTRRTGGTRVPLLLDALNERSADIPLDAAERLLTTLFRQADTMNIDADQARGFDIGSNRLRLHWLLRSLLSSRTTLEERSALLMRAMTSASLSWLVDVATSAWDDYHPRDGTPEPSEKCLLTMGDAGGLRARALAAIEEAAKDGSLGGHADLAPLLYRWRYFAEDDGAAAKAWTSAALEDDAMVARLAAAFTAHSWSHGMGFHGLGDMVAKRSDRASVEGLEKIMDKDRFRGRVEEVAARTDLPDEQAGAIQRFLRAWQRRDENGDRD